MRFPNQLSLMMTGKLKRIDKSSSSTIAEESIHLQHTVQQPKLKELKKKILLKNRFQDNQQNRRKYSPIDFQHWWNSSIDSGVQRNNLEHQLFQGHPACDMDNYEVFGEDITTEENLAMETSEIDLKDEDIIEDGETNDEVVNQRDLLEMDSL